MGATLRTMGESETSDFPPWEHSRGRTKQDARHSPGYVALSIGVRTRVAPQSLGPGLFADIARLKEGGARKHGRWGGVCGPIAGSLWQWEDQTGLLVYHIAAMSSGAGCFTCLGAEHIPLDVPQALHKLRPQN